MTPPKLKRCEINEEENREISALLRMFHQFFSGCFLFGFCSLTFGIVSICDVHGVLIMPLPLPLEISYSCLKLLWRPEKNDFYIGTIWLCSV